MMFVDGQMFVRLVVRGSVVAVLALALAPMPVPAADDSAPPRLTLEEVYRLVEERSPALRAADSGVEEAEGLRSQAGAFPNPELSLESENFGGTGEAREFDAAETTLLLGQEIEIGKRSPRKRIAAAGARIATLDRRAVLLDLRREAAIRFAEVLAAQERALLAEDASETAANIHAAVASRVVAGRDSPVEEDRARAELASARLLAERASSEVESRRRALAALWGGIDPAVPVAEGSLSEAPGGSPSLDALLGALPDSPEAERLQEGVRAAGAVLLAEKRERIPDLFVEGGVRKSHADDRRTYVGEVGLELPLFDRNGGNVRAARASLAGAEAERDAAMAALQADLAAAHAALVSARRALLAIETEILPAARSAFAAVEEGYAAGKFDYLDLQDARRVFVAARSELVAAGLDYRTAAADVERLTGGAWNDLDRE